MAQPPLASRCPQCGSHAPHNGGLEGLCPSCLFSLALLDVPQNVGDDAPTVDVAPYGRLITDRYQIREFLGRGGMGEVYRAFDLKLRMDVALKAVRPIHASSERAKELLRREVRSAREVVSPNVCRIFDLVEHGDQELLSMEFIDGATLAETLRSRGPLSLTEAREIGVQFLAGLDAIHRTGLVHRDFKPENVMITRAGRVVVMDLGIARAAREGATGTISGTPAYMAPEQARGDQVDARADIFAAGVVLAEMISVGGPEAAATREALWRAIRRTPPEVPDGPWAAALQRAITAQPDARFESARALARALEEVTLRLPGVEERQPYPGLAAFTEQDAEYFFGREVEVEALWKKLKRPRLLGLIGPSGAGKSSFLRAGLLPALPSSWKAVLATPGTRPFQSLAQALVPQFAGDTEGLQALLHFEDPDAAVAAMARWRSRHEHTVVIVDQFEELFTQNSADVQAAFARLLARFVLDADTHVLLSLRDDFLIRCHEREELAPMLTDLTLLGPLGESGLRRALVQPAMACGYHFEDEALVEEMVGEVVREHGALPLLAFAASRLWQGRDRENGVLTRSGYREIGGVAGALALHAESALDRIGAERIPIVRELFRNLVTSQATRAVRGRDELLSVFARDAGDLAMRAAESVLNALVDARLLITYEVTGDAGERLQQVEVIHESLLTAWPRLVRWRTQDADGAQLRDQLRQAAQLWHERGRSEDLLWTGVAYQDFALWRERYPGRLSATEEAFAHAAKRRVDRRRQRRRLAGAALLAAVALVAVTTSVLWRRSEVARQQAAAESLRAEAGKLQVMGERELLRYPTGALAYIIRSLELADTDSARLLALRVLQQTPVARIARIAAGGRLSSAFAAAFSPTGEWAAWGGSQLAEVVHRDGQRRTLLGDYAQRGPATVNVQFATDNALVTDRRGEFRIWSVPDGRELHSGRVEDGVSRIQIAGDVFRTLTTVKGQTMLYSWSLQDVSPRLIGSLPAVQRLATGRDAIAYTQQRSVYVRSMVDWNAQPRRVLDQTTDIRDVAITRDGRRVATLDPDGIIRIASTDQRSSRGEVFAVSDGLVELDWNSTDQWIAGVTFDRGYPSMRLFDAHGSKGAEPLVLQKGDTNIGGEFAFDPAGNWLLTTHGSEVAFWPLAAPRPRVFRQPASIPAALFSADGRRVFYLGADRAVHALPLEPGEEARTVVSPAEHGPILMEMTIAASGRALAVTGAGGRLTLIRLDDGRHEDLKGFPADSMVGRAGFSPDAKWLAAGARGTTRDQKLIRVWNLETGATRVYGPVPGAGDLVVGAIVDVAFAGSDTLLASVDGTGLVALDLSSGAMHVVIPAPMAEFVLSRDRRSGVAITSDRLLSKAAPAQVVRFDLDRGTTKLSEHGADVTAIALDPGGSIVATGSSDGTIRVSGVSGGVPHLLLGQEGAIYSLDFSPDGRWLVASGEAFAIRIWPVPDISKEPTHRLPHDRLIELLRSHTNLRAVPDATSATGYKLDPGPFQGWASLPTW